MASRTGAGAAMLLAKQLKLMQQQDHIPGISVGLVDDNDVFAWEVMLMISDDCKFYGGESVAFIRQTPEDMAVELCEKIRNANALLLKGGFFRARLTFPKEYPLLPPKMKFETPIWHPNST